LALVACDACNIRIFLPKIENAGAAPRVFYLRAGCADTPLATIGDRANESELKD